MTKYSLRVHQCIKRLRWLYGDDKKKQLALSHILDYSIPIVYPNHMNEFRIVGHEYEKIKARKKRYQRYIKGMHDTFGTIYLLSLTFTDDVLNNTTEATRKAYVKRWLNDNTDDYFACVDYGKQNEREHYHAIVAFRFRELEPFKVKRRTFYKFTDGEEWPHGFFSIRKVAENEADRRKTVYYALKASDYAFKYANKENAAKPFHKRGVEHWFAIDDTDLPF